MINEIGRNIFLNLRSIIHGEDKSLIMINESVLSRNEIILIDKLFVLIQDERNTTSELALELAISASAISTMLNKLEKKGYIKRIHDEFDRRKVYILPIGKSKEARDNYIKFYNNISFKMQTDYNSDELLVFNKVLKSIETYLK